MVHIIFESLHIIPLLIIIAYTFLTAISYFKKQEISLNKGIEVSVAALSALGLSGHLMQPMHLHTIEPCAIYSIAIATVAMKGFLKGFAKKA